MKHIVELDHLLTYLLEWSAGHQDSLFKAESAAAQYAATALGMPAAGASPGLAALQTDEGWAALATAGSPSTSAAAAAPLDAFEADFDAVFGGAAASPGRIICCACLWSATCFLPSSWNEGVCQHLEREQLLARSLRLHQGENTAMHLGDSEKMLANSMSRGQKMS